MHSDIYKFALANDMIDTDADSQSMPFQTFRDMAVIVDDLLPVAAGEYTTVLFGPGSIGWGMTAPRIAEGTEIENKPSACNGGGEQIMHSRVNLGIHPAGSLQFKKENGGPHRVIQFK
jgi:hypothetical protein